MEMKKSEHSREIAALMDAAINHGQAMKVLPIVYKNFRTDRLSAIRMPLMGRDRSYKRHTIETFEEIAIFELLNCDP